MLTGQFAFDVVGVDGKAIQPRSDWCIAMPKAEAHYSVAAGPEETVPLLEQAPHTEAPADDEIKSQNNPFARPQQQPIQAVASPLGMRPSQKEIVAKSSPFG